MCDFTLGDFLISSLNLEKLKQKYFYDFDLKSSIRDL